MPLRDFWIRYWLLLKESIKLIKMKFNQLNQTLQSYLNNGERRSKAFLEHIYIRLFL